MRSPEEEHALMQAQQILLSEAPLVPLFIDQVVAELAGTDPEDLDREINNIGHLLWRMMRKMAPHVSEGVCLALPFAFIELVRERMKGGRSPQI